MIMTNPPYVNSKLHAFLRGSGGTESSRHERLVREKLRLLEEQDSLVLYAYKLKQLRNSLSEAYLETKEWWRPPWTRYELMVGLVTHILEAYEKVRASKQKDDRDVTLARMGIGDKADETMTTTDDNDGKTISELESELEILKIEITKLHEVYRQECDIFQNLHREYKSLQKYGVIQRYIIIKMLIKIAGKADL